MWKSMQTAQPNVVIFSARGRDSVPENLQSAIEAVADVHYVTNLSPLPDAQLISICKGADYIGLTRRTCRNVHADLIGQLPGLRGLSVYATGTEWLDLHALKRQGIALRHLVDYSAQTVAEHAIGMLLGLSRRLHLSDRVALGQIADSTSLRGWELQGKRIGIVGLGEIGMRIARLAEAFGMQVQYCDPAVDAPFPKADFNTLIEQSEVLMLAASVERSKPAIITAAQLRLMRQRVYIVNPSRPELVDSAAMLDAVGSGQVAGYAVDEKVYTSADLAGVEAGRILQTCHSGWYSNEAMERGTAAWIENLIGLIKHE